MLRSAVLLGLGLLALRGQAQLAGPPAGVPVPPPPPTAAETPVSPGPAAVPAGDLHFRVRLLDGRSGLPIPNGRVRLWYDERDTPGYLLTTDAHGEVLMPEPAAAPVRVLALPQDLYDCRKLSQREPMPGYNLEQTAQRGTIASNRCDAGARAVPHRGELTLFARPTRWYEQLNRESAP